MEARAVEQVQETQPQGTPTLLVVGGEEGLEAASVMVDWMLRLAYEPRSPAQPCGVTNQQLLL
jgi:hypothetical protein